MGQRPWMAALERRHQKRFRTPEPKPRRTIRLPAATIPVAAAVFFTLIASVFIFKEVLRARDGVETSGVVVKRWTGHKSKDYADVVFTTSTGRRVRASISQEDWVEMPKVGTRVRIRYAPSRPEFTAVDAGRPMIDGLFVPVLSLGAASVFATYAFVTWRRGRASRVAHG